MADGAALPIGGTQQGGQGGQQRGTDLGDAFESFQQALAVGTAIRLGGRSQLEGEADGDRFRYNWLAVHVVSEDLTAAEGGVGGDLNGAGACDGRLAAQPQAGREVIGRQRRRAGGIDWGELGGKADATLAAGAVAAAGGLDGDAGAGGGFDDKCAG